LELLRRRPVDADIGHEGAVEMAGAAETLRYHRTRRRGDPGVEDVMDRRQAGTSALWGLVALALSAGHVPLSGAPALRQLQSPAPNPPRSTAELEGSAATPSQDLVNQYCVGCHNQRGRAGGLVLQGLDASHVGEQPDVWERVVRKLRGGLMPPPGARRPDAARSAAFLSTLQASLDAHAMAHPDPGRTETAHRLNRIEYVNAIRDLLAVELDPDLLPPDDSSFGFDNVAGALKMSPALVERYLAVARVASRSAVGSAPPAPATAIYAIAAETQQNDRVDGLAYGTRGGILVRHRFPLDAAYEFSVALARDRVRDTETLELTIDGKRVGLATGPKPEAIRVPVTAGPHEVGLAFLRRPPDLVEQLREPFENPEAPGGSGGGAVDARERVSTLAIAGPYNASGPGDTVSRRRVFVCRPQKPAEDAACAKSILSTLARRAYRGMAVPGGVETLLGFYDRERARGGTFEDGIELALRRLLVSPEFLYRIEADPSAPATRTAQASTAAAATPHIYRVSDLELASRLSFFLWSSIPDDELLAVAARGSLSQPAVLKQQVRRMLADPRSEVLMRNFGGQWLSLRTMAIIKPGEDYALPFDETLRKSMQRETELFLDSVLRENRRAMDLLTADYTFVNERLAAHYGIPHVQGSRFRRVTLAADSPRRGLLGQGSILTFTSPAIRTSPVKRGKWILDNIVGAPPPDPPADVPALSEQRTQAKSVSMRERMARHRSVASCAACHSLIDPAGFALENFDAIGRWRTVDESFNPIDASGVLPDGTAFTNVNEFRDALARHPERFAHTLTERMLTYALGRGLEHYDMPAVRRILSETKADGYRVQAIVQGIVESLPFQYRRSRNP
jgi:mono/diheme cytochrome c family protein